MSLESQPKTVVLTGPTSGLGLELAKVFSKRNANLILVGRDLQRLEAHMDTKSSSLRFVEFDLASVTEAASAAALANTLTAELKSTRPDEVLFISNAGVVIPIGISGLDFCSDLIAATAVNFLTPALITAVCSEYALKHGLPLKILNVSSGAATRAILGWEVYCATKCAARMYFDALNGEGRQGLEIVHFDPGVLDTKMQTTIRASSPELFPLQEQFALLKEEGQLKFPLSVALQIEAMMLPRRSS